MYADLNFTRVVHEDRRIRLEGAAGRHRLFHSFRQAHPVAAAPAHVVEPAAPQAAVTLVRPAPAAPGRTPGAAGRAA